MNLGSIGKHLYHLLLKLHELQIRFPYDGSTFVNIDSNFELTYYAFAVRIYFEIFVELDVESVRGIDSLPKSGAMLDRPYRHILIQ